MGSLQFAAASTAVPQPHDTFRLFESVWPRVTHSLCYYGSSDEFAIGHIGDGEVNADYARHAVENRFDGKIMQLKLAPHDGSKGIHHGTVWFWDEIPDMCCTQFLGDALIVRKGPKGVRIATFVGDSAVIVCASDEWLGFIHCGTPELFAEPNVFEKFDWPAPWDETRFFVGPCISGRWYAYDPDEVPERYKSFLVGPEEDGNAFDNQWTFGLDLAIERTLKRLQPASLTMSGIDPFQENINGRHCWASARYAKFQHAHGHGNGLSPRDCAMLTFRDDPANGR